MDLERLDLKINATRKVLVKIEQKFGTLDLIEYILKLLCAYRFLQLRWAADYACHCGFKETLS